MCKCFANVHMWECANVQIVTFVQSVIQTLSHSHINQAFAHLHIRTFAKHLHINQALTH